MKIPKRPGLAMIRRDLHGDFSPNMGMDFEAWSVYTFLCEQANWADSDKLAAGEVSLSYGQISVFTGIDRQRIKRHIDKFKSLELLEISRSWSNKESCVFFIKKPNTRPNTNRTQDRTQDRTQNILESQDVFNELNTQDRTQEKPETEHKTEQPRRRIKRRIKEEEILPATPKPEKKPSKSGAVISAYAEAYLSRYGVQPISNARNNSIACKIIDAAGEDLAIDIVHYYLDSEDQFYTRSKHPLGLCLSQIETLATEVNQIKILGTVTKPEKTFRRGMREF